MLHSRICRLTTIVGIGTVAILAVLDRLDLPAGEDQPDDQWAAEEELTSRTIRVADEDDRDAPGSP